jgi:tape measure domain-containing protein
VAGAGATLRAVDAFQTMNNQLRLATTGAQEFAAAQADVVRIAQQTFQPVESVSELYGKASRAAAALGLSQAEIARITQTVSQALLINNTTAGAASGALQQFGQALANGKVQAEEFNSILDGMAPLIQGIEKDMGLIPGSLKRMVVEGKVSSQQFAQMILQNRSVSETFANYIPTISQNMVGLRNQFVLLTGTVGDSTGATQALADVIAWLTRNLPTVISLIGTATAAFVAYRGALIAAAVAGAALTAAGNIVAFFQLAKTVRDLASAAILLQMATGGWVNVIAGIAALTGAYVAFDQISKQLTGSTEKLNEQLGQQAEAAKFAERTDYWKRRLGQAGAVVLDTTKKVKSYMDQLIELAGITSITTAEKAQLSAEVARLKTAMEAGNLPMAKRLELAKQLAKAEGALEGATVRRSLAEAQAAMAASAVGAIGRTPSGGPNLKDSMARARDSVRASAQDVGALIDLEFTENVLKTAQELGDRLRDTLGASVASAFEVLATRGATVGDAFGALGAAMLRGLGDMTIAFGISVMKIGKLMTAAVSALKNLNGPAAVAAGLAIVAVGGLMRGAAGRAFGGVGGGSAPVVAGGGLGGMAGPATLPGLTFGPTMASSASSVTAAAPVAVTIIGPNDPQAQRQMQELIRNANRRGNIMGA